MVLLPLEEKKFEPTGGPAGGTGGDGGDIYIREATKDLSTLEEFRYKTKYKAENGQKGLNKKRYGKKREKTFI